MKELYTSLAKFNQEVDKIAKDANNPMFRNNYATVDQIITEIRPILAKNGLSIIQIPMNLNLNDGGEWVGVKTILIHESGQTLESDPFYLKAQAQKVDKTTGETSITPQSLGSAITYARRYSLTSFLCLATGQDDDGNQASGYKPNGNNNSYNKPATQKSEPAKPNDNQMKRYYAMIKQSGIVEKDLFAFYNKTTKKNITKDTMSIEDYNAITQYIQKQIDAKEQGGK